MIITNIADVIVHSYVDLHHSTECDNYEKNNKYSSMSEDPTKEDNSSMCEDDSSEVTENPPAEEIITKISAK